MKSTPPEHYYKQSSERLSFRAFEPGDIEKWEPFFVDNPTLRFLGGDQYQHLSNKEKSINWIQRQIDRKNIGKYGQLAVHNKETGEFIGVGGIIDREMEDKNEFEITYSLLPSQWGKGYATELANHFRVFAFDHIENPSVISIIHEENEASMNVARKNGMEMAEKMTFMEMPVVVFRAKKHG